ncbi:hypothetical protein H0H81_008095 [Sphagnurus paluster]|uniref:O-methyltransferase C-terminal domain-containing protein n=1 Tax=Sphagnurus paluster TaxID=117069 RepID=A0A9P7GN71_9AGAR|nr:hypothetical protein H0H81_008095 [Sphagnurus paluster]
MATEIQQLTDLITTSVSALLQLCDKNKTPFPDPNEPFTPQSEAFRADPAVANATNIIAAAAMQLAERVLPPHVVIFSLVFGHLKNAALRLALELNITEILREAGRLLRALSLHHCYREVTPNVFANTRISTVLDTGKNSKELREKPEDKHEQTNGMVALLELNSGDLAKSSAYLLENLRDPKTSHSSAKNHAPLNRAFNMETSMWEWYETPEQEYRRRRFAIAMRGIAQMQPQDILDDGKALDWEAFPADSVVVDVGGGVGTASVALSRNHPHLKFIVQDSARVCAESKTHWAKELPEVLDTGRLAFTPKALWTAHDFFTAQPVKNASVFILKQILHNWDDARCVEILKALRAAAMPDTKLIILDTIVACTCHDSTLDNGHDKGAIEAPVPLLANFGAANIISYTIDLAVMCLLNSGQRTLAQTNKLLKDAGWKIIDVKRRQPPSNFIEPIVAVPYTQTLAPHD